MISQYRHMIESLIRAQVVYSFGSSTRLHFIVHKRVIPVVDFCFLLLSLDIWLWLESQSLFKLQYTVSVPFCDRARSTCLLAIAVLQLIVKGRSYRTISLNPMILYALKVFLAVVVVLGLPDQIISIFGAVLL